MYIYSFATEEPGFPWLSLFGIMLIVVAVVGAFVGGGLFLMMRPSMTLVIIGIAAILIIVGAAFNIGLPQTYQWAWLLLPTALIVAGLVFNKLDMF